MTMLSWDDIPEPLWALFQDVAQGHRPPTAYEEIEAYMRENHTCAVCWRPTRLDGEFCEVHDEG